MEEILKKIFQINDGTVFSQATNGVFWSPLLFILVVIVVLLLVYLLGKAFFREDFNKDSAQTKPFYSGNDDEINYNIKSGNLYWGFKTALKKYYKKMYALHTGDLNDYMKWLIIVIAVCLLLLNGGLL